MATARRARAATTGPVGLTDDQVADLRDRVARGEPARVVLLGSAPGLPAGTRGTVVRVGDPAVEAECVTVRIAGDELPFAAAELTLSGRGVSSAVEAATTAAAAAPARRRTARAPRPAAAPAASPPATATAATGAGGDAGVGTDPPARTRRTSRPASTPSVTITLRFGEGAWTVDAERGGRRISRATPVPAPAVRDAVTRLGVDRLDALVAETLEAHRAEVESRAAALRQELKALEASLRQLRT